MDLGDFKANSSFVVTCISTWAAVFASGGFAGDYVPVPALARADGMNSRSVLVGEPTLRISYSWHDIEKTIALKARDRATPSSAWNKAVDREESVAYYMTAVAPIYAERALIVVGVQGTAESPETTIEKWKVRTQTVFPSGDLSIRVTKEHILTDHSLTHLLSAAAGQDGSFLIAHHLESREVWKIDLQSGQRVTVATPGDHPGLTKFNSIVWKRHAILGDAFIFGLGRRLNYNDPRYDRTLVFWDSDSNGIPESIEDFSASEYVAAGHLDISVWHPDKQFDDNWP